MFRFYTCWILWSHCFYQCLWWSFDDNLFSSLLIDVTEMNYFVIAHR